MGIHRCFLSERGSRLPAGHCDPGYIRHRDKPGPVSTAQVNLDNRFTCRNNSLGLDSPQLPHSRACFRSSGPLSGFRIPSARTSSLKWEPNIRLHASPGASDGFFANSALTLLPSRHQSRTFGGIMAAKRGLGRVHDAKGEIKYAVMLL